MIILLELLKIIFLLTPQNNFCSLTGCIVVNEEYFKFCDLPYVTWTLPSVDLVRVLSYLKCHVKCTFKQFSSNCAKTQTQTH